MLRGSYVENADHAYVARLSLSEGPAPDHVEIDDSQFLFSAHFKKAGADLVLTGDDGHRLVLVDYFNLAKRPDLTSHGATMSADLVTHLAGPDAPGQYAQAGAPAGAQVIGKCERITGGATVQHTNGVVEEIKAGDAVLKGDVVMTNDGSAAVLSLIDGTVFNMGASARMVLNELIYDANSTSNSALMAAAFAPTRRVKPGSERLLQRSCQTLVSSEQSAQRTAHHRISITAHVFFGHCSFDRLSRFRFHCDLRPQ
jgi:hypothetical protein